MAAVRWRELLAELTRELEHQSVTCLSTMDL